MLHAESQLVFGVGTLDPYFNYRRRMNDGKFDGGQMFRIFDMRLTRTQRQADKAYPVDGNYLVTNIQMATSGDGTFKKFYFANFPIKLFGTK